MVAYDNARSANSSNASSNSNGSGQKRRLSDFFMTNKIAIDYKDTEVLRRFLSPEGKILPGRRSGLTSANQRKLTKAIKRARQLSLLPYVNTEY